MLEQTALPPTLLCMAALAIFFACTGPWTEGNPWFATGAVDSLAIVQGQWWRLVTALTLHADFNFKTLILLCQKFLFKFF